MVNARSSCRGFTLTELLLSLALLGIIIGMALPSFRQFIVNAQIRSAAESFQSGLNLARSEALRRNARVTFWMVSNVTSTCTLSSGSLSWVVSQDNPSSHCGDATSDVNTPRIVQVNAGTEGSPSVMIAATTAANNAASCVTFNGFGRMEANCTGGATPISRVVFSATSGQTLEVRMGSGGGIRMCNPAAASGNVAAC